MSPVSIGSPDQDLSFMSELLPTTKNDQTLHSYQENIEGYVHHTPSDITQTVRHWIDRSLEFLPKSARILEVGSGFGRDAAYIEASGFGLECSDATKGFVDMLLEKGFNAHELNIVTDQMPGSFDFVFANAVLLHFEKHQVAEILKKIYQSLNPNGRFAFSLKQGSGEAWSSEKLNAPRYFCYWQKSEIEKLIEATGFSLWEVEKDSIHASATWLHIIAWKAM